MNEDDVLMNTLLKYREKREIVWQTPLNDRQCSQSNTLQKLSATQREESQYRREIEATIKTLFSLFLSFCVIKLKDIPEETDTWTGMYHDM